MAPLTTREKIAVGVAAIAVAVSVAVGAASASESPGRPEICGGDRPFICYDRGTD
jgi:hypothetical protein